MAYPITFVLGIAYVAIIITMFYFVVQWNKRRQFRVASAGGYFPQHEKRNIYYALADLYSPDDPNGHEILTAALLERTVEDVRRLVRVREDKPAVQLLVQRGTVGQDLFEELILAEREIELELNEIKEEAILIDFPGGPDSIIVQASMINDKERNEK